MHQADGNNHQLCVYVTSEFAKSFSTSVAPLDIARNCYLHSIHEVWKDEVIGSKYYLVLGRARA